MNRCSHGTATIFASGFVHALRVNSLIFLFTLQTKRNNSTSPLLAFIMPHLFLSEQSSTYMIDHCLKEKKKKKWSISPQLLIVWYLWLLLFLSFAVKPAVTPIYLVIYYLYSNFCQRLVLFFILLLMFYEIAITLFTLPNQAYYYKYYSEKVMREEKKKFFLNTK